MNYESNYSDRKTMVWFHIYISGYAILSMELRHAQQVIKVFDGEHNLTYMLLRHHRKN